MKNSPVICQWYVSSLLSPVHAAAHQAIIHHYMDDVLVCAPNNDLLAHALDLTVTALVAAGFELQELKIQKMPSWKYLGLKIVAPLLDVFQQAKISHQLFHQNVPGLVRRFYLTRDQAKVALAAPAAVAPLLDVFQQAKISHQLFHQNVPGLVRRFYLTRDQAKVIVATCPSCQRHAMPTLHAGVNPCGLCSNEVWQTDVTHVSQFGRLKYVHVSVDTFSSAVYASAHTGEKSGDAIKHMLQAFSFMGIPRTLKTDNGPGYTSREFCSFLQQWGVEHKTGIPHSPTGQAIMERTHQTLKESSTSRPKF
ncbi:hypothetical protein HGM15179_016311 [Zosterops borbonicus]|uniref:Reverse transcriptase n=1 Tax=Zosterops borbonicus TaxID=364589 RepID=A0A8K1G318_9PASS|nr:hypothetical protein HGM15179_016311 [Zosterops borbonicus]